MTIILAPPMLRSTPFAGSLTCLITIILLLAGPTRRIVAIDFYSATAEAHVTSDTPLIVMGGNPPVTIPSVHHQEDGYSERTRFLDGSTVIVGPPLKFDNIILLEPNGGAFGIANADASILDEMGQPIDSFPDSNQNGLVRVPFFHLDARAEVHASGGTFDHEFGVLTMGANARIVWDDIMHVKTKNGQQPPKTLSLLVSYDGKLECDVNKPGSSNIPVVSDILGHITLENLDNNGSIVDQDNQPFNSHVDATFLMDSLGPVQRVLTVRNLSNDIRADIQITVSASANNRFGDIAGTGTADFSNTIAIIGIIGRDDAGLVIPPQNLEITSSSGFHYPVVVAEPSSAVLLIVAIGTIALGRRVKHPGK